MLLLGPSRSKPLKIAWRRPPAAEEVPAGSAAVIFFLQAVRFSPGAVARKSKVRRVTLRHGAGPQGQQPEMGRSIRPAATRCLSFPCKIPANLLGTLFLVDLSVTYTVSKESVTVRSSVPLLLSLPGTA